jgi:hypothetical protein
LHDLSWRGQQHANIDHVVVGPPGIFVIASTSWSGRVTVEEGVLRQDGHDRSSAIRAAIVAAAAVSATASSVRFDHVHGVLCLADQSIPSEWVGGVLVCSAADLVEELTSYVEVLPGAVGTVVAADVQRQLGAASGPMPVTAAPPPGFAERMDAARQDAASAHRPVSGGVLVRIAVGGAVAIALVSQPQLVTSVPNDIADFVSEQINPAEPQQDQLRDPVQRKKQPQKPREQKQRQSQQ